MKSLPCTINGPMAMYALAHRLTVFCIHLRSSDLVSKNRIGRLVPERSNCKGTSLGCNLLKSEISEEHSGSISFKFYLAETEVVGGRQIAISLGPTSNSLHGHETKLQLASSAP